MYGPIDASPRGPVSGISGPSALKPHRTSTGRSVYPKPRTISRALAVSTSGEFSNGSWFIKFTFGESQQIAMSSNAIVPTNAIAFDGRNASLEPDAATMSGDGVSPAASASASGSPPGSAAASANADGGRSFGLGSRHRRIARSIAESRSGTSVDGFAG